MLNVTPGKPNAVLLADPNAVFSKPEREEGRRGGWGWGKGGKGGLHREGKLLNSIESYCTRGRAIVQHTWLPNTYFP